MLDLPLAHAGHVVAVVPFFAPPLLLTAGVAVLTIRDRLRHGGDHEDTEDQDQPRWPSAERSPDGQPIHPRI
jgi:hypothetical protein